MKIKVTKKNIQEGKKHHFQKCPVALALKANGFKKVSVDDYCATVDGKVYSIRRGSRFIKNFDAGLPVKPTTVEFTCESN
jgi:hypothetical protein